jgi:hypothetical protein
VSVALALQLCGAALVVALGVMLLAVGSFALGGLVAVGGGTWFAWCLRRA